MTEPTIDHDPPEEPKPDAWHYISYGLAALILLPIGLWLKIHYVPIWAEWSRSFFH